ncbi:MAG: hypothetical protein PVI27_13225 [Desulfobacteraceae bacterium]
MSIHTRVQPLARDGGLGDMAERTAIMLDGRAAEKIRFDDFSTGAGEEREKGTRLARHMVCQGG